MHLALGTNLPNLSAMLTQIKNLLLSVVKYRISGIFRVEKYWRKCRFEGVLNFHWVLFSLFQGESIKTYSRVNFSLCLFLAISGRSRTKRILNPREKFPIYGMSFFLYYYKYSVCKLISSTTSKLNNILQFDHQFATVIKSVISGSVCNLGQIGNS